MGRLKCTQGPWEYETVFFSEISEKAFNVCPKGELDDYRVCMIRDEGGIGTDPEDNAKLIVEAGTVYDETGMTPKELVEKINGLELHVRRAEAHARKVLDSVDSMKDALKC